MDELIGSTGFIGYNSLKIYLVVKPISHEDLFLEKHLELDTFYSASSSAEKWKIQTNAGKDLENIVRLPGNIQKIYSTKELY